MDYLLLVLYWALRAYFWLIIFTVVVSWLVVFDVLNTKHKGVRKFCELLNTLTNPLVLRIRKIMPPLGGIDLSPMIIIFGLYFLMSLIEQASKQLQGG
ncbi:MAG: YggT family protein [Alphaproteobacteria bacterium]|nr:YggT family protein [Alphaproteobacteria bacterium]